MHCFLYNFQIFHFLPGCLKPQILSFSTPHPSVREDLWHQRHPGRVPQPPGAPRWPRPPRGAAAARGAQRGLRAARGSTWRGGRGGEGSDAGGGVEGAIATNRYIWGFPEIGLPPVIIHFRLGIFPYKPSIWGYPIYGNPHIYIYIYTYTCVCVCICVCVCLRFQIYLCM